MVAPEYYDNTTQETPDPSLIKRFITLGERALGSTLWTLENHSEGLYSRNRTAQLLRPVRALVTVQAPPSRAYPPHPADMQSQLVDTTRRLKVTEIQTNNPSQLLHLPDDHLPRDGRTISQFVMEAKTIIPPGVIESLSPHAQARRRFPVEPTHFAEVIDAPEGFGNDTNYDITFSGISTKDTVVFTNIHPPIDVQCSIQGLAAVVKMLEFELQHQDIIET